MTIPELWGLGWTADLFNHLWQSTAVALFAWLLTFALRGNTARVRYAIWIFASMKFLVPFRVLTSIGAHWAKPALNTHAGPAFYFAVEEFSRPFRQSPASPARVAATASPSHGFAIACSLIAALWLFGCIVMLARWIAGWRRAAGMAKIAQQVNQGREFDALRQAECNAGVCKPVALLLSPSEFEPGIFGVIQPVLLWPSGLSDRLDDAQIAAIMAHEIEHVRRRDNLTATIHAVVEALFWFHPLVRWMSAKLNEERERACDERVLERNAPPEAYAESILKVCAFCVEPSAPCVSGVSGADLTERILRIMTHRSGVALSFSRKLVLSAASVLLLATPLGFGVLRGQAASSSTANSSQASTPDLPKYEVATIKPSTSSSADGRSPMRLMMTPDGTSLQGVPVQLLLQQAFGVERDRIVGAPAWVKSNRYDIEAKVAPGEAPKMEKQKLEQRREMLLPLLAERFNLKYHHETRELPMYTLVVAKGGPKLTESKPEDAIPDDGAKAGGPPKDRIGNRGMITMNPGGIEAHGGGITFLAHALSAIVGRSVVDKTGLTGTYDFKLQWTPDDAAMPMAHGIAEGGPPKNDMPADAGGPSLFTALEEQLGLKLESQKGPADVIVIDHIDLPSQN